MADNRDPIIPSLDESKATFRRGFIEWSSLVQRAEKTSNQVFLDHMRLIETAFPDHPQFPSCLDLKKSPGSLSATGSSSWATTIASSGHGDLAQFRQPHEIVVTRSKPTYISLTKAPDIDFSQWFGGQGCHVTILILAWTYILSARWTEIIPGAEPIRYTNIRPDRSREYDKLTVDLGSVSGDAERWWEAVLAPRQGGWLATVNSESKVLRSPWSIRLPPRTYIEVSNTESAPATGAVASSSTALRYLAEYCATYDLADQSRAALSAVLFLPLATFLGKRVKLPIPEKLNAARQSATGILRQEQTPEICSTSQLDKLLALSCNTRGLPPILLSHFFDCDVPCNLASPWLQGTFSALDRVSGDRFVLAQTLASRDPRLGFLWVGAIILGCHTQLLERARHDCMEVDMLSAMWTNTLQTFMQVPVTGPVQSGRIDREDECRLLYLVSKSHQLHPPLSPWKPFGSTALEDTELDVRVHAQCQGHGLQYIGWDWDCWIDGRPAQMPGHMAVPAFGGSPDTHPKLKPDLITNEAGPEIPYDDMDLEDNGPSWKATLNIFMWLRRDGFPSSEQCIRRHGWLCEILDEEEADACESWTDEEDIITSGRRKAKSSAPRPRLGGWLASTQAMRRRST